MESIIIRPGDRVTGESEEALLDPRRQSEREDLEVPSGEASPETEQDEEPSPPIGEIRLRREDYFSLGFLRNYKHLLEKILEVRYQGYVSSEEKVGKDGIVTHLPKWVIGEFRDGKMFPEYELVIDDDPDSTWDIDILFTLRIHPNDSYRGTQHDFVGIIELWFNGIERGLWSGVPDYGEEAELLFRLPFVGREWSGSGFSYCWYWAEDRVRRDPFENPCNTRRTLRSFERVSAEFLKQEGLDLDPLGVEEDLKLLERIYRSK